MALAKKCQWEKSEVRALSFLLAKSRRFALNRERFGSRLKFAIPFLKRARKLEKGTLKMRVIGPLLKHVISN